MCFSCARERDPLLTLANVAFDILLAAYALGHTLIKVRSANCLTDAHSESIVYANSVQVPLFSCRLVGFRIPLPSAKNAETKGKILVGYYNNNYLRRLGATLETLSQIRMDLI